MIIFSSSIPCHVLYVRFKKKIKLQLLHESFITITSLYSDQEIGALVYLYSQDWIKYPHAKGSDYSN